MTSTPSPSKASNEVIARIRDANQQFMNAFRGQDPSRIASLYAQNAMLLPPGADFVQGSEAIRDFWKGVIEAGITDATLESASVEPVGESAIEVGQYLLIAGDKTVDKGKYLVVWRVEGGTWKLYRDIWNSSIRQ